MKYFFDTDCISTFMWVDEINIVEALFGPNIIIPREVYSELSNPLVPHLKADIDSLIQKGMASIMDIRVDRSDTAFILFESLTAIPPQGGIVIGKGEAASIALAVAHSGTLASNNLKDVSEPVKKYKIKHITTEEILRMAIGRGIIVPEQATSIWRELIRRGNRLPDVIF